MPGLSLSGLKIVADCANGAAAAIAPELFRRLNGGQIAGITLLNIAPDGRNINASCGALHPAFVAAESESAERTSASPSTATPTAACWPALTTTSSTATPFC